MGFLFPAIPLGIFILDFFIKKHIEATRIEGAEQEICRGKVVLTRLHNRGAMLGVLGERQELVSGISLGMTLCILLGYLYLLTQKGNILLKTAASFALGGALSNVYDRIQRKYVVDYVRFKTKWKRLSKIVFNISDFFIFIGTILFIFWNGRQKS